MLPELASTDPVRSTETRNRDRQDDEQLTQVIKPKAVSHAVNQAFVDHADGQIGIGRGSRLRVPDNGLVDGIADTDQSVRDIRLQAKPHRHILQRRLADGEDVSEVVALGLAPIHIADVELALSGILERARLAGVN
jgi:hypothetical protein